MKISITISWIIMVFALTVTCSDRERVNPLDPKNPDTGGKPVGLNVISMGKKAVLTWNRFEVKGLVGMEIFRREVQDNSFQKIAMVEDFKNRYEDTDIDYDITYTYRIRAVTDTYQSPFSDTVSITPGPSSVWATISSEGKLLKLTHDASHKIFSRSDFLYPLGLAFAEHKKGIWMTDLYRDEVIRITENGRILSRFSGFNSPVDIDYDPLRGLIWVADRDNARIVVSDTMGHNRMNITGFVLPVSVSLNENSGDCWVTDSGRETVNLVHPNNSNVLKITNLLRPEDADVYSNNGTCWIADSSRLVQVNTNGNKINDVPGFQYVNRVAVNQETGECWAVDVNQGSNNAKIVKISASGDKLFELSGFYNPQSLDVNEYDGSCLVADTWNYRIVKISEEGNIVGEWQTTSSPRIVRVDSP